VREETLGSLPFPSILQEAREGLCVDPAEIHPNRGEPLPPPDLLTRLGVTVNRREDAALVEHHVHVVLGPLRREDLAGDAERRPTVMILLDCLGQPERELPRLFPGHHQRGP
jgi:hypothetical protein